VDTYPCPACGGVADETHGCRSCGRGPDPLAARLARINRELASVAEQTRQISASQAEAAARQSELDAQRDALIRALGRKLATEKHGTAAGSHGTAAGSHGTAAGELGTAAGELGAAAGAPAIASTVDRPGTARVPGAGRASGGGIPDQPRPPGFAPPLEAQFEAPLEAQFEADAGWAGAADRPGHGRRRAVRPEASVRSVQNTLLALGGLLLGIAAIVFTVVAFTEAVGNGGRAFILTLTTTLALAVPVLLARRQLTATAETVTSFGLLLVLLDGLNAYQHNLAGIKHVSAPLYIAVLFGLVAAIAAGYRPATALAAPQFAALICVQPVLPLLGAAAGFGRTGFGAICAMVAAADLGAVRLLSRRRPSAWLWPRLLRELAWGLFGLALAVSAALAAVGLATASSVDTGVRAGLALLLAAAVGVAAGELAGPPETGAGGRVIEAGDRIWRRVAGGGAAAATIAALTRVDALAWPRYTLVLTAVAAALVALVSAALPAAVRVGPQQAALLAAGLTAAVVGLQTLLTAVAAIRAATRPQIWAADLVGYAQQVRVTSWQVPVSALLLAVVGAIAVPARWRLDAVIAGAVLAIASLPGAGAVNWWQGPVLAAAGAAALAGIALYVQHAGSGMVRGGSLIMLALLAIATGLARPGLTAAVCSLLALGGATATTLAAGWPDRFGPYVERVADITGALATMTAPAAVGTLAYLLGTPGRLIVPVTVLAGAVSLTAAALGQVAARSPRTGSAGGALAAALGCTLLSLHHSGAAIEDLVLSLLLLAAAGVTAASRALEISPNSVLGAVESTPAAVGALIDAVRGDPARDAEERAEPRGPTNAGAAPIGARVRRRAVDAITLGAAGAIATLILATARLTGALLPGIDLVTATAIVLLIGLAVRAMPERWRPGPRQGAVAVGGVIGLVAAGIAVAEAVAAVAAATPWWHADLDGWTTRVTGFAPFGWQVPATLLLAAAAAWAVLYPPTGAEAGFLGLALAGLALPAAFGLSWWAPIIIASTLGVLAGTGAALVDDGSQRRIARERLVIAAVLGLYATATGMARPAGTAAALGLVVVGGVGVAALAEARRGAARMVPGVAVAAALLAAPGMAATLALTAGSPARLIIGAAMTVAAAEVMVLALLRLSRLSWLVFPAIGVGVAALASALTSVLDPVALPVWSGAATLIAVAAAGPLHRSRRAVSAALGSAATAAAILTAVTSAPVWGAALFGPYLTLRRVWAGYANLPSPQHPAAAAAALALLALAAGGAGALLAGERARPEPVDPDGASGLWQVPRRPAAGDRGQLALAAAFVPVAALVLVLPGALGAGRGGSAWVALGVALGTGFGASLVRPAVPTTTRLLRLTAGVICGLVGAAGIAGALATRANTLAALGLALIAAVGAGMVGRDPAVRTVAWTVAAAAALALPVTGYAAAGLPLRGSAFWVLAICAALVGSGWPLTSRPYEAAVVESAASVGAAFALLLVLESTRDAAAVLTIWGVLLGMAALRGDRPARRRRWLARAAVGAELAATWLLLYSTQVGLPEAYTLPFAGAALIAGAVELRRRPELSSWIAYGPALAAGFLPSTALVLVEGRSNWRQAILFLAAVLTVLVGARRQRLAPAVAGGVIAVVVALHELLLLWLTGAVAWYYLFGVTGAVFIGVGATYERRRRELAKLRGALRQMS
jgi:hypothetical protein